MRIAPYPLLILFVNLISKSFTLYVGALPIDTSSYIDSLPNKINGVLDNAYRLVGCRGGRKKIAVVNTVYAERHPDNKDGLTSTMSGSDGEHEEISLSVTGPDDDTVSTLFYDLSVAPIDLISLLRTYNAFPRGGENKWSSRESEVSSPRVSSRTRRQATAPVYRPSPTRVKAIRTPEEVSYMRNVAMQIFV